MAKYYGIDLGTTNSCVAVYDSSTGETTVLKPVGQGDFCLIPSVVFYKSQTEILVGKIAKKKTFSENTKLEQVFQNFKPELGKASEHTLMVRLLTYSLLFLKTGDFL